LRQSMPVMTFRSRSYDETVSRGRELGESLRGGVVVLLSGPLGSGKTAFTKGIALGLGIDELVTSPSFSIMNEYGGDIVLRHFDFYRLADPVEMEELLRDYLYRQDTVCVVEWGEPLANRLWPYTLVLFKIVEDGRLITVRRSGP
jgi:tRNA threonylcarbamoyladenosine biosynthesis protein TsaE